MKKTQASRIPNALVGIAGVHYVAAELSLRKLIALPTIRNTAGFDIIATTRSGDKHANIQVKTTQKRDSFFLMPSFKKIQAKPQDWYVLVRPGSAENRFEVFMLKGVEAKAEVKREHLCQLRRKRAGKRKSTVSCIYVDGKGKKSGLRWKRGWESWTL